MHQRVTTILRLALLAALAVALPGLAGPLATAAAQPSLCPAAAEPLAAGPVVVQGWVINHRELPVDGTRTPAPLALSAVGSDGAQVTAPVASNGYFQLKLAPGVWDFQMQLPESWDGIVPVAARAGLARTGCTSLAGRSEPYLIVFKIRRLFDVTALKWEDLPNGVVQPGEGWRITFQPVRDPFAILQAKTTDANGAAAATLTPGTWTIYETGRRGWTAVTPAVVSITLDQYAPPGALDPVVFKNRRLH
jgi:hypothetical protein